MNEIIKLENIIKKIIDVKGYQVLLDSDIADLYGIETKRVNEAVNNNPDKFPSGYVIALDLDEWNNLKSKISTSSWGGKNKPPKAFTEKGLYMLATILKSPQATETTIAIIETFTKIREFTKVITQMPDVDDEKQQKSLIEKSGQILADILDDNMMEIDGDETTIELNLALMKVKHTIKRKKRKNAE